VDLGAHARMLMKSHNLLTDGFDATVATIGRILLRWSPATFDPTSIPCLRELSDRKNKDVFHEPATSATGAVYGADQLKMMAVDAGTARTLASNALLIGP
jgi:hypothetical protein